MKILILGAGQMGPAAAFAAMTQPDVSQVILADADETQLQQSIARLRNKPGAKKLGVVRLDLRSQATAAALISSFDGVVAALPQAISRLGLEAALRAGAPLVDLARPHEADLPQLRRLAETTGSVAVPGCGLEPGLTEMMAVHLAGQLDAVTEVHIKCGGIPAQPQPPLGYKILFGGRQLPLHEEDAAIVVDGQLTAVPRYSEVEPVVFAGVGQTEAWHEGFMPWLLDAPGLKKLRRGTQKTVRWPGYAAKVTVLKELGLLSRQPLQVDGVSIAPKRLLDTLLYPRMKLEPGEEDITLLRVDVYGQQAGQAVTLRAEMIDRYDPIHGLTAMARTTAFTGAIVARMLAAGELSPGPGLHHPEQIITGVHFEQLLADLAQHNITFGIRQVG